MIELTTNQSLIYLIAKSRTFCTITEIVKTCYLIDLASFENDKTKITDFSYVRYYYGPYSRKIPETIDNLIMEGIFSSRVTTNSYGEEKVTYYLKEDLNQDNINIAIDPQKIDLALTTIDELLAFKTAELTQISYSVGKLKEWGAKLGGTEHFNEVIL